MWDAATAVHAEDSLIARKKNIEKDAQQETGEKLGFSSVQSRITINP